MTAGFCLRTAISSSTCDEAIQSSLCSVLKCFAEPVIAALCADPLARNDGSQKALRIDIYLQLEIALGLRPRGEPFAQIFRQVDAPRRLYQQAEAVAAL